MSLSTRFEEGAMENRWQLDSKFCLEGLLLVAAPGWHDQLFGQSVCLVVHHSPQRAVGVFLNRSLGSAAAGLWQHLVGEKPVVNRDIVHFGGPHSGPVVAVHDRQELAEYTSADGVYLAAQIDNLKRLVTSASSDSAVKIIVGQADWQPGQLDREFAEGKWLPLPVSPALVFADETDMWPRAMREIANQYVMEITGSRGQPRNILAN
jgi:putative transcriptional regulator